MSSDKAKDIIARLDAAKAARGDFDPVWEEVAEYMGPAYRGWTSKPRHTTRNRTADIDSTARRAAGIFAAGMLSGVSSPSQRWFRVVAHDHDTNKELDGHEAIVWAQAVEDLYYATLSSGGFYPAGVIGYHQAGLFGWQCMYVDDDPDMPDTGVRFRALPLHEIYAMENFQGMVDTVFRVFTLTARQAVQKWGGDNLPSKITKDAEDVKKRSTEYSFLHAVWPRRDDEKSIKTSMLPYMSMYVALDEQEIISEGGYEEMPYIVTRSHRLPGTAYSYSLGTEALADAKMICEMKRLILEAGQLSVAPPYLVPDDGFLGRFSFEPRAMNYYRRAEGNSLQDFGPLSIGGDPRFSFEMLQATKADIKEAFYEDLFLAITSRANQGGVPTAHEVAELAGERMFLLGPMLVNQQNENFSRLFERLFRLLSKRGELPPPPQSLVGHELDVEYVSPLMLAQKAARTNAVLQGYGEVGVVAQIAPDVLDIFKHDEAARLVLTQRGFPQTGLRSRADVDALRKQRAKAAAAKEQAAMEAAALEKGIEAAPKLGKAPEKGSIAAEVVRGMRGEG